MSNSMSVSPARGESAENRAGSKGESGTRFSFAYFLRANATTRKEYAAAPHHFFDFVPLARSRTFFSFIPGARCRSKSRCV
jgi:hypothetical protein